MSEPLAYFISWTTKGSWLHGDARGWVREGIPGIQEPDPEIYKRERNGMTHDEILLEPRERQIVTQTITDHCDIRNWTLHAVNVRSNHVHVVVTANNYKPETVMEQFKAWCSRRLNDYSSTGPTRKREKKKWWTKHGSTKWINDEEYFHNAVNYVLNRQ